jgi:hypothetical protein
LFDGSGNGPVANIGYCPEADIGLIKANTVVSSG